MSDVRELSESSTVDNESRLLLHQLVIGRRSCRSWSELRVFVYPKERNDGAITVGFQELQVPASIPPALHALKSLLCEVELARVVMEILLLKTCFL